MFTMRTTKPTAGNKFYIRKANGGYSTCVKGSPTDKDCNVLSNCVGYSCGRFNEIIGSMKYPSLNCNAENFIERAKSLGLEIVNYPVLGGIMVWQKGNTLSGNDGAGHVEIVENIYSESSIYTSASNYGGTAFYNAKRTNSNGRWGLGSGYKFRGCIVNPSVGKVTKREEDKPTEKYKVGDTVIINGVYVSSTSNKKYKPAKSKGKITKIVSGARNPYLLENGNIGWTNDDCIVSKVENKTYKTITNCKWLNLRTSASYGNNIYKAAKKGTRVEYLGNSNGWAKIKYDNKVLYCGKNYLK